MTSVSPTPQASVGPPASPPPPADTEDHSAQPPSADSSLPILAVTSPTTPGPSLASPSGPPVSDQSFRPNPSCPVSVSDPTTPILTRPDPRPLPGPNARHTAHPTLSRPGPGNPGGVKVPPGLAAKMAAMTKRKDQHPGSLQPDQRLDPLAFIGSKPSSGSSSGSTQLPSSKPSTAGFPSMMNRRQKPQMRLGDLDLNSGSGPSSAGVPMASQLQGGGRPRFLSVAGPHATPFANFSRIVDPSGRLNFGGKAVVHSHGVDFSNGSSFSINMNELTLMEELGKGNYGTVQKVFHKPTKVVMAMKEIRLELEDSKLKAILTELDILHRATSNTIVEFYGAFFIESCVYYCMEYMDGGSLDKLAGADVPEPVLARVTSRVVEGLRFLKDELQTMHRDVKPTNILINRKGETKLCDFGVSGQLERSLAKTNIGCQSYMAPERIQGEQKGEVKSYTVSSDVWSLGLSIVEFAIGHYPYPPETYSNIFAQLNEIVHGHSPKLPSEKYSDDAQDFVERCLKKDPKDRASYNELLEHKFLLNPEIESVDMVKWVEGALEQVGRKT